MFILLYVVILGRRYGCFVGFFRGIEVVFLFLGFRDISKLFGVYLEFLKFWVFLGVKLCF